MKFVGFTVNVRHPSEASTDTYLSSIPVCPAVVEVDGTLWGSGLSLLSRSMGLGPVGMAFCVKESLPFWLTFLAYAVAYLVS